MESLLDELHHFYILFLVEFFLHTMFHKMTEAKKREVFLQALMMSFFHICLVKNKTFFRLKLFSSILLCVCFPRYLKHIKVEPALPTNTQNDDSVSFQFTTYCPEIECISSQLNKVFTKVKSFWPLLKCNKLSLKCIWLLLKGIPNNTWLLLKGIPNTIWLSLKSIWSKVKSFSVLFCSELWKKKASFVVHFAVGVAVQVDLGESLVESTYVTLLCFFVNLIWEQGHGRNFAKTIIVYINCFVLIFRNESVIAYLSNLFFG